MKANVWLVPDQMSSAARYLALEWGDYGYRIEGVESPSSLVSLFRIISPDGSRFTIAADKWGNCRYWDTEEGEKERIADMHKQAGAP